MVKMWSIAILLSLVAAAIAQESGVMSSDDVVMGDMVLTRRQHQRLYSNKTIKRLGKASKANRWPGNTVPVKLSPQFNQNYQRIFRAAADYISAGSCIKFDFNPSSSVYLNVQPGRGCLSYVGYLGYSTTMTLDPNGCPKETLIHELLHVLGLYHMISAPDRDNYISIDFNNIESGHQQNFAKITEGVSMFNTQFDLQSIMNYPADAFAINKNSPVITLKGGRRPDSDMGYKKDMSPNDWKRLNRMYECPGRQ